jgi:hypothetical protein
VKVQAQNKHYKAALTTLSLSSHRRQLIRSYPPIPRAICIRTSSVFSAKYGLPRKYRLRARLPPERPYSCRPLAVPTTHVVPSDTSLVTTTTNVRITSMCQNHHLKRANDSRRRFKFVSIFMHLTRPKALAPCLQLLIGLKTLYLESNDIEAGAGKLQNSEIQLKGCRTVC